MCGISGTIGMMKRQITINSAQKENVVKKWSMITIIIMIAVLLVVVNVYRSRSKEEKRLKENECIEAMQWFDPYVSYEAIKLWNENGVRGWGEWWSDETYDLIEAAIRADEKEDARVKSNALLLLNGSSDLGMELDICAMDVSEFADAAWYIGETAKAGNFTDENGDKISETDIIRMWWSVNRRRS